MRSEREIKKWKRDAEKLLEFDPYHLDELKAIEAVYRMSIGERSNGKSYSVLDYFLTDYFLTGNQFGYVRRLESEIKGQAGAEVLAPFQHNGFIEFMSEGKYNAIKYQSRKWYLGYVDEDAHTKRWATEPVGFAFALNVAESTYKSRSYPGIKHILFDEFLTRSMPIQNEFVNYMNLLSTIIRYRNDVDVYMVGNTVDRHSIYFDEMGLNHVKDMKPGTIDRYTYGKSGLSVAVEYTPNSERGKPSDVYFAFDNPQLRMITTGEWEIASYPHLDHGYRPADVVFKFFVRYDGETLRCDIVNDSDGLYMFVFPVYVDIGDVTDTLVYTPDVDKRANYRTKLTTPMLPVEKKINDILRSDKVFYATNKQGETMRSYLMWCRT